LGRIEQPNFELALRVYGHQKPVPPQDCNDTRLEVAFSTNSIPRIQKTIAGLRPMGTTPIANSILKAGGDFPDCADCREIIILITDVVRMLRKLFKNILIFISIAATVTSIDDNHVTGQITITVSTTIFSRQTQGKQEQV
jgi:hypothetical protein